MIRPRRSVLYMPGANLRAMDKARNLPADTIVMDLEDAVAPAAKAEARQQVVSAVQVGGYAYRELVVRINPLDSIWGEADLEAMASLDLDGICLPKVESAQTVRDCATKLTAAGFSEHVGLWAMVETPAGVQAVDSICAAHPRLQVLMMGTSDLAKECRVSPLGGRPGLQYALSRCVVAARAAGIDIVDGVYLDLQDGEGFLRQCRQGLDLGFDGKSLIHPSQIQDANTVFAPAAGAAEQARRIIQAWDSALAENKGIAVLDGKLVEVLHAEEAQRVLALTEAIAQR